METAIYGAAAPMVGNSSVGASPAKKQRQMTRSYAAVVRSSFKPTPQSSSSSTASASAAKISSAMSSVGSGTSLTLGTASNTSKLRSQMLECGRKPNGKSSLILVAANESKIISSVKKQRVDKPGNEEDMPLLLRKLDQALELEVKYRGAVQPSSATSNNNESNSHGLSSSVHPTTPSGLDASIITSGMRDGSAHVLRCLKVWYDLPSDVFFNAISSIDRFLAKMKAQPKHLSCIAVSAFHLACRQHQQYLKEQAQLSDSEVDTNSTVIVPEPSDLVCISQSRCSPSDLLRMQGILQSKLEVNPNAGPEPPVTAVTFLRLMYSVCRSAALSLGLDDLLPREVALPDNLLHQLEILACDSVTLQHRPCEVALALLTTDFQQRSAQRRGHTRALMGFITELQKYCNVPSENFLSCLSVVMSQLDKYNSESTVAHRQRLVWKLSNRTLRHLRPTDKLRATLPTIQESGSGASKRLRTPSVCSAESLDSMSVSYEDLEEEDEGEEEFGDVSEVGEEECNPEPSAAEGKESEHTAMEVEVEDQGSESEGELAPWASEE